MANETETVEDDLLAPKAAPAKKKAKKPAAKKAAAKKAKADPLLAPKKKAKKAVDPLLAPKKKKKKKPAKKPARIFEGSAEEVRAFLLKLRKATPYQEIADSHNWNIRMVRRQARALRDTGEVETSMVGTLGHVRAAKK